MSFHLDSVLFRDTFGTQKMRQIFCEDGFLERFMSVEAALARAEAKADIIPGHAAEIITDTADPETMNPADLEAAVEELGLFSMAIIETWNDAIGEAGEYLHWGASTQDISDTTVVLQLRDAMAIIRDDLVTIGYLISELIDEYGTLPILGRTQYQAGPPVTIGLKLITWLDELTRHLNRLDALRERLLVVHLSGATGTMATLGQNADTVRSLMAEDLGLAVPPVGWTATRDRFGEAVSVFDMIGNTLGRMARQLLLLNRPELREVDVQGPENHIGSSTNPHKRNPVRLQVIVALSRLLRGLTTAMDAAMQPIDERDRTAWHIEFAVIPEGTLYLGRMLKNTREVLDTLSVNAEALEQNLNDFGDLILSERVMIVLADHVGRQTAHAIVRDAAEATRSTERSFLDCLLSDSRCREHFDEDTLKTLLDPGTYTGASTDRIDAVLNRFHDAVG